MKKIIFSIIGSMLIGFCAVQAQDETTGAASKSETKQQKQRSGHTQPHNKSENGQRQSWQQQSDRNQGQDSWANEGMVVIEKEQIPSSLKKTLTDKKYAGWENATIYHNTSTGEYIIAPRAYRFDGQGKEVEMSEADRMGYGQGRSSRYSNGEYSDHSKQQRNSQGQAREQMREPAGATRDQQKNGQPSGNDSRNPTDQSSHDQSHNGQSTQDHTTGDHEDNASTAPPVQQPSSEYRTGQNSQNRDNTRKSGDSEDPGNTQNNSSTQSQSDQGTR